ncbi:MAG TPA: hypothetical protein VII76_17380 [Acidimicrobiales bacterium]
MHEMPGTPPVAGVPPWASAPETRPSRTPRWLKLAVGVGAAAGVAVGATALAQAATAPGSPSSDNAASVAASTSTTTTMPGGPRGFSGPGRMRGGIGFGGLGGFGGGAFGGGPLIDGQFTIKGPNGYETLAERTGTVSSATDTSGSTWSLTVKSADGTSGTFTVDSGTSVNGGEMGIGSVKTGDTVLVTAVVSGDTDTAKQVTDQTVLKANGGTWRPMGPSAGSNTGSGTPSASLTPPV